jgi:hypothetical protein
VVIRRADLQAISDAARPRVFAQEEPAATWTIEHDRGGRPAVTVIVDGRRVFAGIEYPDDATIVVTFRTPQVGEARFL